MTSWEQGVYHNGYTIGPYQAFATWSMDSPAYSTISGSGFSRTFTGTDAGTNYVTADFGPYEEFTWDGHECADIGPYYPFSSGTVNVNPPTATITKADNSELPFPYRIGINGGGNNRVQHLKATISPAAAVTKVSIAVTSKITKSNQTTNQVRDDET